MTERSCSIEGCKRKHMGRGFCQMHGQRVRKHGDPGPAGATKTHRVRHREPEPLGRPYWPAVDDAELLAAELAAEDEDLA